MTQETLDWFVQKAPGFASLPPETKMQILDFSMLWSFFEGTELDAHCNIGKLREYIEKLKRERKSAKIEVANYLEYLKSRYYIDGKFTQYYRDLYLSRSGNPSEVPEAIRDQAATKETQIIGCLIVVFRLRNNLFHGEKWAYQLEGDGDNFIHANQFLRNVMSVE
jgi:hypothetical protein